MIASTLLFLLLLIVATIVLGLALGAIRWNADKCRLVIWFTREHFATATLRPRTYPGESHPRAHYVLPSGPPDGLSYQGPSGPDNAMALDRQLQARSVWCSEGIPEPCMTHGPWLREV